MIFLLLVILKKGFFFLSLDFSQPLTLSGNFLYYEKCQCHFSKCLQQKKNKQSLGSCLVIEWNHYALDNMDININNEDEG